jgi:hypothetical protein
MTAATVVLTLAERDYLYGMGAITIRVRHVNRERPIEQQHDLIAGAQPVRRLLLSCRSRFEESRIEGRHWIGSGQCCANNCAAPGRPAIALTQCTRPSTHNPDHWRSPG